MRRQHHVVHGKKLRLDEGLVLEHVEAGAGDAAFGERADERGLVDQCAARGIDEKGARLHQRELARPDQMPGFLAQRRMDRDEVRVSENLVEPDIGHAERTLVGFRHPPRAPVQHLHGKAFGAPRHGAADAAAAADQAQHLAADAGAREQRGLRAGKPALPDQPVALDQAPGNRQHEAEGDVGGRLADDRGNDGHQYAPGGRLGDRNVVRRDRHRGDHAQTRVCGDHVAIDAVVEQGVEDLGPAHARAQRRLVDRFAGVGIDLDLGDLAQAGERAFRDRLGDEHPHQTSQRTTPATPSTATCAPSGMRRVASSTPSTIGMPRSRASEARCEVLPPSSATTPATCGST